MPSMLSTSLAPSLRFVTLKVTSSTVRSLVPVSITTLSKRSTLVSTFSVKVIPASGVAVSVGGVSTS